LIGFCPIDFINSGEGECGNGGKENKNMTQHEKILSVKLQL
jgi:hypothetical protein